MFKSSLISCSLGIAWDNQCNVYQCAAVSVNCRSFEANSSSLLGSFSNTPTPRPTLKIKQQTLPAQFSLNGHGAMRSLRQLPAFAAASLALLPWDLALVPRRAAVSGVGCGCWGCSACNAGAEVELKEELPLSRGRQDADFAKGMAFGFLDFSLTRRFWFSLRVCISYAVSFYKCSS